MTGFGKYCRNFLAGSLVFGGAIAVSVVGASLSASPAAAATARSHSVISLAGPTRSGLSRRSALPLQSARPLPSNGLQEPNLPMLSAPGNPSFGGSLDMPKGAKAHSSAWKVEPSANVLDKQGLLYTDSCGSASACMAVGYYIDTAGFQGALAEAWNGSKWSLQKLPNIPAAEASTFFGVSCTSATACTAVGAYFDTSGVEVSLAEVWTGTTWSVETTPNPSGAVKSALISVSCASASKCIAVGSSEDGSGNVTSLVEKRKGTSWSLVASPNPSGAQGSVLGDVSCTSPSACTAVGQYIDSSNVEYTLAEEWNGTSLSVQTTPNPSGSTGPILNGVACTSASACTAVGDYDGSGGEFTLAEVWNGSSWSIESTPNPGVANSLGDVACNSAGDCTAVGDYAISGSAQYALAESWNGSSWAVVTTPNPAGAQGNFLSGVACNSAGGCTAVGSFTNSAAIGVTLAEAWNGASWSIETTANPKGVSRASQLFGVSCTSANACTAVGLDVSSSDVQVTLAEAWNGTKWSLQTTPNPAGALSSQLSEVSCSSASACTAVGYYTNSAGSAQDTLAEAWNGSSWTIQTTPNPSGAQASELSQVSCTSASACTAVGYWIGSPYSQNALVEAWNGTSWSIQTIPAPTGSQATGLYGVACTSGSACTIAGAYLDSSSNVDPLAEASNGTSWTIETTPSPSGSQGSLFSGVSCTSANACTAVGNYADSSGTQLTFAEAWNGTSWTVETTPDPTGSLMTTLSDVSCTSATACNAVGSYVPSTKGTLPLAEAWNGTSWSIQATPVPGSAPGELTGVACISSGCTAAGAYVTSVEVTLVEVKS